MRNDKRQNIQRACTVQGSIGYVLAASQNHKVMGWDRDLCVVYMPIKQTLVKIFIWISTVKTIPLVFYRINLSTDLSLLYDF